MVLKLYKFDGSPPARAVMMVIEQLKLDVEYEDVNILQQEHRKPEYLKLNPQHTIPLLMDDDYVLTDSHAIAAYLVTVYGKDDSLYPKEPKLRGIVDQRLHFDTGVLFPSLRRIAAPILFYGSKEISKENVDAIIAGYDFSENFLTGPWMAGDQFTIADICCVATISSLNEMIPIDAEKYPKLTAWLKRCSELEIYKKKNAPGCKQITEIFRSKMA